MDSNEEYVRETLDRHIGERYIAGIFMLTNMPEIYPGDVPVNQWPATKEAAWQAAAEFTRERQRLITEKQEEIEWLARSYCCDPGDNCPECPIARRVLAILEAQLADLKRGMREE